MKIYTLTFLINNYGSVLQAYALQSRLKEFGTEPTIVIKSTNKSPSWLYRLYSLLQVLKPVKHYSIIQRIKKRLHIRRYAEKNRKLQKFINDNISFLRIDDENSFLVNTSSDDVFLVGSDQIWSMALSPLSEWYTLHWAENSVNRKYSYAASIGLDSLTEDQKMTYSKELKKFEVISFRERQALNLLSPMFPEKVRQDLDPTLLYDGVFWRKLKSPKLVQEPYVFVYMLRPDENVIRLSKKIANERKCKVVYTGLLADNYNGVTTVCDAGIAEFLSYIDNADVVIANSFHGTVFSVLFEKPFLSVKVESTSSRVESFLSMVGLMSQYVKNVNQNYSLSVNFTNVRQILEKERQKSLNYLQSICQRG